MTHPGEHPHYHPTHPPRAAQGAPPPAPAAYPYPPQQLVHASAVPAKSPGLAALLAGLFGPLGMLYATVPGALAMFCANLVIVVLGVLTLGLGLLLGFFTWVGGIIWAYSAASNHNQRITAAQVPWPYPPPSY
ncbi:hypothetical protein [Mycobacterium sp. SMC-15]|uniref:hypothetical protein n=1 Tax=Mycobacterium sp. SMC-15 TaxID=3381627 RepID=UPI003876F6EB